VCLITLAYKAHPRFPLIVAANRDEFLDREADAAHFWPDHPSLLAGRDRKALGTWIGVTRLGRFAAVTNHRDLRRLPVLGPSRGILVRDALLGLEILDSSPMEGFNLIYGTMDELRYRSNISGTNEAIEPGVHGLSNALLNTPWPKVRRAKEGMRRLISREDPAPADLFALLADQQAARDMELPDTGLDPTLERALSAIRIDLPHYGTRCSTVIMVDEHGHVRFEERTHGTGVVVIEEFRL